MLPVYRRKETVVHRLHPLAALTLYASLVVSVLVLQNPLQLALMGVGIFSLLFLAEVRKECRPFLHLGLFMALLFVLLNPLVNRQGGHVLVYGPRLPVLGRMDITLEALAYGVVSGFRLLLVVVIFSLLTTTVNPDDLLDILSAVSLRSSLAAALAVRLYPGLVMEAKEMMEVQLARGETLRGGSRWERARAHFPFWMALFRGSLDRAAGIAEAMSARGFGSGKVTRRRRRMRGGDLAFIAAAWGMLMAALASSLRGGGYRYFPTLGDPLAELNLWATISLAVLFAVPVLIGRLWKRWPWLRSRI